MKEALTKSKLLLKMSDAEKEECLTKFQYQIRKYEKGDSVVFADEEVIQLLVLVKGSVNTEMADFSGKSITIAELKACRLLAPAFIFGKHTQYPVSIYASSQSEVMAVAKDVFLSVLLQHKQLQINFLNLISSQAQFLTSKLSFLQFKTIKSKVSHFLLEQRKRRNTDEFEISQTQKQLAFLFGVTRPSLSRTLIELQRDEIISLDGKKIVLLNVQMLREFID